MCPQWPVRYTDLARFIFKRRSRCRLAAGRNGWRQMICYLLECSVLTDLWKWDCHDAMAISTTTNMCLIFSGMMNTCTSRWTGLLCSHRVILTDSCYSGAQWHPNFTLCVWMHVFDVYRTPYKRPVVCYLWSLVKGRKHSQITVLSSKMLFSFMILTYINYENKIIKSEKK